MECRRWLMIWIVLAAGTGVRAEEPALKPGMAELHSILMNLNEDLARGLPPPGTAEHRKIEVRMERFSRLAHRITANGTVNGTGQLYPILGEALPEQADQMSSAWRLGQTSYSRAIFRTLSATCVECHAAGGPTSAVSRRIDDRELDLWNPVDRGRYLRSMGLNEPAFETFVRAIGAGADGSDNVLRMEDALYELLSLGIRTPGGQSRLIGLLKPLTERENLPRYLRSDLKGWIRDLETWSRETPSPSRKTGSYLLSRARQHIRKAKNLQESSTDRSSLVWYWRAVADLYGALRSGLKPEQRGESLFLLGSAFEVLTPVHQETLHERFYEACIRQVPHTPRSDLCYRKLERSVIAGYTGSSGTRIPEEVRKRLLELWGTAFLKKGLELR